MKKETVDELEKKMVEWWTEKLSHIKKPDFSKAYGLEGFVDVVYVNYIAPHIDNLPTYFDDRNKLKVDNAELVEILKIYGEFFDEFGERIKNVDTTGMGYHEYGDLFKATKVWILEISYEKRFAFQNCCPELLQALCWKIACTQICPVCHKYNFDDEYDICPYCGWENEGFYYDSGANNLPLEEYRNEYLKKMSKNSKYHWERDNRKDN